MNISLANIGGGSGNVKAYIGDIVRTAPLIVVTDQKMTIDNIIITEAARYAEVGDSLLVFTLDCGVSVAAGIIDSYDERL